MVVVAFSLMLAISPEDLLMVLLSESSIVTLLLFTLVARLPIKKVGHCQV